MVVRGPVVREALDQLVGGELNAKSVHDNVVLEVVAVLLVHGALEAESVHEQVVGVGGLYVATIRMKNPRFRPKTSPFGGQGKAR